MPEPHSHGPDGMPRYPDAADVAAGTAAVPDAAPIPELPATTAADAGKTLSVNEAGDGYELGDGNGGSSQFTGDAVTIEPTTLSDPSNNGGLRIESPLLSEDYGYVLVATLKDPDQPEIYLPLFNVDSAGEMTLIVRDLPGGALPFTIAKPAGQVIFQVDNAGRLVAPMMPTADPHVAGALYSDAGTIKISAG